MGKPILGTLPALLHPRGCTTNSQYKKENYDLYNKNNDYRSGDGRPVNRIVCGA